MDNVVPVQKKPKKTVTHPCRLLGNGVNLAIGDVTLEDDADLKAFAKKAYGMAKASLKKLELPGYHIVVYTDAGENRFSLEELQPKKATKRAA